MLLVKFKQTFADKLFTLFLHVLCLSVAFLRVFEIVSDIKFQE